MKEIFATLLLCWIVNLPANASFIVYEQSFENFVRSRDLVFKGTVLSVTDIQNFDKAQYDKIQKGYPNQIAIVRIDEILKRPLFGKRFKEGQTIELEVGSTKQEIQFAGVYYHDPGSEAFWMLKSRRENYGLDSERANRGLNFREQIEKAIRRKMKKK